MDTANGSFTACFLGFGNKGQEIGKQLDIEFNALIKYYQEHRNDEQFTEDENILRSKTCYIQKTFHFQI